MERRETCKSAVRGGKDSGRVRTSDVQRDVFPLLPFPDVVLPLEARPQSTLLQHFRRVRELVRLLSRKDGKDSVQPGSPSTLFARFGSRLRFLLSLVDHLLELGLLCLLELGDRAGRGAVDAGRGDQGWEGLG